MVPAPHRYAARLRRARDVAGLLRHFDDQRLRIGRAEGNEAGEAEAVREAMVMVKVMVVVKVVVVKVMRMREVVRVHGVRMRFSECPGFSLEAPGEAALGIGMRGYDQRAGAEQGDRGVREQLLHRLLPSQARRTGPRPSRLCRP